MQRRDFIKMAGKGAGIVALAWLLSPPSGKAFSSRAIMRFLRPPGALPEKDFTAACINCGQCAEICPNRCISYFGSGDGLRLMDTPYIIPRQKGCILCMKCGDACPSGAIRPVRREMKEILAKVHMGRAMVDRELCLSWQGQTCGVCYRACPLPDVAIRVGMLEQPHVLAGCVGCGLCERSCIQMPQAIRIIPDKRRRAA